MMNRKFQSLATSCLAALTLGLAACATPPAPVPLAESLSRESSLSIFNSLVQQAGMSDNLRAAGPLTVFAPSDEAFKAVPAKTMAALAGDKAQLKALLSYHIISGRVSAADVKNGEVQTLQGTKVALSRAGTFVTIEDAMVQQADISASNGVAHVIDRVLTLPKK